MMDWLDAKDAILSFLSIGCVGWITYELRALRESVEKLNINAAVVLERISFHEKEIENQDFRINKIEGRA